MKKVKQVIALIGVIALLALYVSTVVLACIGSEESLNLLKAAIFATIVLPVLLWAYSFIYRLLKNNYSPEARERLEKQKEHETNSAEKTVKK